jgi:hypothetical protein
MSDITAKVLADDDMPSSAVSSIEFLLDKGCDIFLDGIFLECRVCDINRLLLELFAHVNVLDDGLGARRDGGDTAGGSVYGGGFYFNVGHGGGGGWKEDGGGCMS